ncbi:MAG: hypothetical protein RR561_06820 [Peptostreptococcus sp.]|uniref:hypothetical protein n=1 Tax=Peptostreptococcus sp. TaxID=1262 RepID=UPI002FC8B744
MENRIEVKEINLNGYQIGSFMFTHRLIEENEEKEIELDVYKVSGPVVLYVKTYKAPFIPEATPINMCEALYEEFFAKEEDSFEE